MFTAINKKTGDLMNSLRLVNNLKYPFPDEEEWIADPEQIENWEEIKVKYAEINVIWIEHKEFINFNGTKVFISPHFRIPNAKKLGINYVPESKEHKLAKNWMYNRLLNDDFLLFYSDVNKPHKYINAFKLSELPIDKDKICTEALIKIDKSRIVDVILPFVFTHPLLGNGICFEIQFSYQRKKTEDDRTLDIGLRGYSACWLHISDFEKITELNIELKKQAVKVDSWLCILNKTKKNLVKDLKYTIKEQIILIEREKKQIEIDIEEEYNTWYNWNMFELKDDFKKLYEQYKKKITQPTIIKEKPIEKTIVQKPINQITIERPICYKCNSSMILTEGQYGKFWSCSRYSQGCKNTYKADKLW